MRYVHRDIGRVLEDVQPYPVVATSLGLPGAATTNYLLTNPGPETPVVQDIPGATVSFESPVHDYNAIEVTANRRLANRWSLTSSYRWSRLTGNFEGFFRNDNGQSDPGISSLYDYPTNDPTYATIGAAQFGYTGDIRFLGAAGIGPLPLDRTHDMKAYGTYAFGMGLNLSAGLEVLSGAPLTAFAAHPIYDAGGEIPLTVRGAGFQTSDGFRTRTPWTKPVNAGVLYNLKAGGRNLHADCRRVQRVQHADRSRLRQLLRAVDQCAEPGLRHGRRVRRGWGTAVHQAAADQDWRALRVLSRGRTRINTDRPRKNTVPRRDYSSCLYTTRRIGPTE